MALSKTLIILRHGQAKNAGISEHDHNRTLTIQGIEEARFIGEILAERGIAPDLVLCSTATRTRETLAELQNSLVDPLIVEYEPKIYNASEVELLAQIAKVTENINTLMVIGHNPGLYQLSLVLAKEGDKQMHNKLQMQFPTCALVVINFEGNWQNILNSRSKLTLFAVPEK